MKEFNLLPPILLLFGSQCAHTTQKQIGKQTHAYTQTQTYTD